jgi:hypothetical protein
MIHVLVELIFFGNDYSFLCVGGAALPIWRLFQLVGLHGISCCGFAESVGALSCTVPSSARLCTVRSTFLFAL